MDCVFCDKVLTPDTRVPDPTLNWHWECWKKFQAIQPYVPIILGEEEPDTHSQICRWGYGLMVGGVGLLAAWLVIVWRSI